MEVFDFFPIDDKDVRVVVEENRIDSSVRSISLLTEESFDNQMKNVDRTDLMNSGFDFIQSIGRQTSIEMFLKKSI